MRLIATTSANGERHTGGQRNAVADINSPVTPFSPIMTVTAADVIGPFCNDCLSPFFCIARGSQRSKYCSTGEWFIGAFFDYELPGVATRNFIVGARHRDAVQARRPTSLTFLLLLRIGIQSRRCLPACILRRFRCRMISPGGFHPPAAAFALLAAALPPPPSFAHQRACEAICAREFKF